MSQSLFAYDCTCMCVFEQHMDRTFYDVTGNVKNTDSGLFIFPFDRNGLSYLKPSLPVLSRSIPVKCDDLPYCGWPYYFPLICYSSLEYVTCFLYHMLIYSPWHTILSVVLQE